MAKKQRRVTSRPAPIQGEQEKGEQEKTLRTEAGSATDSRATLPDTGISPWGIATGVLAGLVVYVSYYPSDSVSVDHGDALWVTFIALAIAAITFAFAHGGQGDESTGGPWPRWLQGMLDLLPWFMAAWIMLAAFRLSPPGNLRMATNEGWFWIAGAAVLTAARRLLGSLGMRRAMLVLILGCALGLAVHGLHQHFISLPQNRFEYEQHPELVLQQAGLEAPEGSTQRMVFENRLYDGGATATFALANSLAAVLLIGVVGAVGVLRSRWSDLAWFERLGWSLSTALCGSCLLATASRSALVATMVGIAIVVVAAKLGRAVRALAVLSGVSVVIGLLLATFGNAEWFDQAPASLAFRFQYWRSTMQLAGEHPWFGAGPGNFQSAYERYREDSAHEQIADPHNLFFETVSSGGFVAAGLLTVLVGLLLWAVAQRVQGEFAEERPEAGPWQTKWVWLGSSLSLGLVWILSIATGVPPDIEAHLFAVPAAIVFMLVLWPSLRKASSRTVDLIASGCLLGLALHLLASGGWTVPGVAVPLWLFAAILLRRCESLSEKGADPAGLHPTSLGTPRISRSPASLVVAATMLVMLGGVHWFSIEPIRRSRSALVAAGEARERGRVLMLEQKLGEAIDADPWSIDARLQQADWLRWMMVISNPTPSLREAWESSIETAKRVAGENPSTHEILAMQQLHVYQRYGDDRDLQAAATTIEQATRWSRANERLHAQLAVVKRALGDDAAADRLTKRAETLAQAGGNFERILAKQLIADVQVVGAAAERQLSVGFAADLLAEPAN